MKTLVNRSNPRFNNLPSIFDELIFNNERNPLHKTFTPSVNIKEDEAAFTMEFSLPGYLKEDIDIKVENEMLTVSSEKKHEVEETEENFTRKEFSFASFKRSFTLPEIVDVENIEAKAENGILTVVLPKNKELLAAKVKSIAIK